MHQNNTLSNLIHWTSILEEIVAIHCCNCITMLTPVWVISDNTIRTWQTILQSDCRKSLPRSAANPDHLSGSALLPQVPLLCLAEATTELIQLDQCVQWQFPNIRWGNIQMPQNLSPKWRAELNFEPCLDEWCRHAEEAEHKTSVGEQGGQSRCWVGQERVSGSLGPRWICFGTQPCVSANQYGLFRLTVVQQQSSNRFKESSSARAYTPGCISH